MLYIHIPFCRQACYYCDFHFSTSLRNRNEFLSALKKEILLQKNYFISEPRTLNSELQTIYFGGGTPSVLSQREIMEIFETLSKYFTIRGDAEITLEANPDDCLKEKLTTLAHTPVNRLSIGIQSFSDEDLNFLHRIHNSNQAIQSVKNAREAGFENISVDLIYGIPTLTDEQWKKNIETTFALNIPHVSCYALTVEKKTALFSFIKKKKIPPVDEEKTVRQFELLMDEMEKNGFMQYEISNFCKKGFYSKHNSGYWTGEKYLGLGPSAHSYNGEDRQWNISSNAAYIQSLKKGIIPSEKETLTEMQKFNEYILLSLRTMWGINLQVVQEKTRRDAISYSRFMETTEKFVKEDYLQREESRICLTRKGKLFADRIAQELALE